MPTKPPLGTRLGLCGADHLGGDEGLVRESAEISAEAGVNRS